MDRPDAILHLWLTREVCSQFLVDDLAGAVLDNLFLMLWPIAKRLEFIRWAWVHAQRHRAVFPRMRNTKMIIYGRDVWFKATSTGPTVREIRLSSKDLARCQTLFGTTRTIVWIKHSGDNIMAVLW